MSLYLVQSTDPYYVENDFTDVFWDLEKALQVAKDCSEGTLSNVYVLSRDKQGGYYRTKIWTNADNSDNLQKDTE